MSKMRVTWCLNNHSVYLRYKSSWSSRKQRDTSALSYLHLDLAVPPGESVLFIDNAGCLFLLSTNENDPPSSRLWSCKEGEGGKIKTLRSCKEWRKQLFLVHKPKSPWRRDDVYWHVNVLTYAWGEGWCVLAAYACTKANGRPWTAARFPIGSSPATNDINLTLIAWLHTLSSVTSAVILSALVWSFTRLPPGPRRITPCP